MQHVITYLVLTEQTERLKCRLRGLTVKFLFQMLIPLSAIAQENPWEQETKEENPWGTSEVNQTDSIAITANSKVFVLSQDTVVLSTLDPEEVEDFLKAYGKSLESGSPYLAGGIITGFALNIFSIPIMGGIASSENKVAKQHLYTFIRNNPEATAEEVKHVRSGLRNKRINRAMIGCLSGIATFGGVIITVLATSF